ncbi:amino acid adenylation domain-containing protein [Leptolyngbya sp. NK1-12]|uniref:Amino acid adenylation domain-containing protein n=1 Tax=Leptolyngbya sp. NK1-12 TaxID=2547451 RepID=A0AA96W9V8_9CYAN|nr:amino acid adenylation domain-containing protein [Leptolyngbya sp. NK1-12]
MTSLNPANAMNPAANHLVDLYELSPMQQGMLFHSLYAPESGLYIEQRCCQIQGINLAAFKQAWQQVCDRHAILRTAFVWEELDKPLQVVYQSAELPWLEQDWRGLSAVEQQNQLATWLESDRQQGFVLNQAPLMRCALLQIADDTYNFVWTHHHLLLDGWCNAILLQEVFACYEAACQGRSIVLPQPRPYRDYILWLQQQDMAQVEQFWRRLLQGFTTPTFLLDAISQSTLVHTSAIYTEQQLIFTPATTSDLQTFVQQHHLTLNTVIQGAWAILLSCYSQATDVLFGMTVSGRPPDLDGIERMIGLFINTVPVRVQLDPETPLVQWLQQLQSQQAEQIAYSYSPLVDIQAWSDVPQGTPLFDSLLIFENYPTSITAALQTYQQQHTSLLQINPLPVVSSAPQTNYPLTLTVLPGTALTLQVSYDSQCVSEQSMQRLLGHLHTLLAAFICSPEQPLSRISMLTQAEQQQLWQWNQTYGQYDLLKPDQITAVHQLIATQAERIPDAIALVHQEQQLTYGELNTRANQLAYWLHQRIEAESSAPIGVCLDRSPEQIISLLAILKAGAAYLPLDPTYPPERLAWMLEDAQVQLVLTRSEMVQRIPELQQRQVFLWDRLGPRFQADSFDDPAVPVRLDQLAYVIYTSGSTGRPKGVMIPHRALLNYTLAACQKFELTPRDRVLQFASISFDTAAEEIFPTLLAGATLVLRTEEMLQPENLLQSCCNQQLTILDLPTAYWHLCIPTFTQALTLSSLPSSLRLMIIGGEAAALDRILAWQQIGIRLLNTYGPTETTIVATWWEVPLQSEPNLVAVGWPIPNGQVYVLDTFLNPVPIGVAGELYIGGAGVAQGYLNQPQLTVEKFLLNPFTDSSTFDALQSPYLYRTGDRVRYLPDGNLEFLGRLDHQIKLRGIRVEPGEIEAWLEHHPAVQTAIVTLQSINQFPDQFPDQSPDQSFSEPQLVAYYLPTAVSSTNTLPTPSDLRQFLSHYLPLQIIPAAFVPLETLPLTPSGKVDRMRLAASPLPTEAIQPDRPSRPTTPTEELLLGIWETVLERSPIGLYDSFFELGGHSLRATQVMSRIRQILQVEIPLRYLFEQPTITALAQTIEQFRAAKTPADTARIVPLVHGTSLPLSYAQQRQWFLAQLEPDSPLYNISSAVRIMGELNPVILQQSFEQILSRHQGLRAGFWTVGGQPVQQIVPLSLEMPCLDLSELPEQVQTRQVQQLTDRAAKQPFALDQPPLLRLKLLRLNASNHILLLTLHHIVADGWSLGILVQELAVLYPALQRGEAAPLPPLPIQYADFAAWQRRQDFAESLAYWKTQLQDAPVLELPTDYPRPAVRSLRGATHRFQLSPSLTQALHQFSRQMGCTLFMTLLTGFKILLHRYTDSDDIVVGTVIANRNRAELEGLIGFFVNTLALRSNLAGNPSLETVLHQIRATALAAYAHQDLPFEQLVDALQLQRLLSHTPLFQVMFVLQNAPLPEIEIDGLTWTPMPSDSGTAKFDLTLSMQETAGVLDGTLEYSLDLFAAETIERMAGHFQKLLEDIVVNPEQRLSDLTILTSAEQKQIFSLYNISQVKNSQSIQSSSIHQLFEQQVELTPDAIALVHQTEQLSYTALNQAANQLAHYLQAHGISPGEPIGIYLERSTDLIISILAVLKVGCAYLPLDLSYPTERLAFILTDAQVNWVLTRSDLPKPPLEFPMRPIYLDADRSLIANSSTRNPVKLVTSEHLAYIMYTSGSTGTPKGVCVPHRGVVRLVRQQNYVELTNETLLQAAPIAFDASTFEIWGALLNGGRLVLLPTQQPDLEQLAQTIAQYQISTLWLTAGLFHLMVEEQMASLQPLRQLLAGGDSLSCQHVQQLTQTYPHIRFINGYGPTENTTFTCCHTVRAEADDLAKSPSDREMPAPNSVPPLIRWECVQEGIPVTLMMPAPNSVPPLLRGARGDLNPVPIGTPISGTEVYILDRYLQPVPVGIPGELYTAGLGLARGYLNRPALTAETFIPNPFTPASRLYKTGDRVRYRLDGIIEYLGRFDQQVKIRGFRVEPGEIAALLQQHPAIQTAVVVPVAEAGSKRLIAYVVPIELNAAIDSASLRDFLKAKLPDYMLPAAFVWLDTLPLTANGKVDRRALPLPTAPTPRTTAPRTATETTLCQIWTSVLGRPVGIDDNFFEQGGDSILAIQIVSRAHQAGFTITPKQVFQYQTIAELAAVIDQSASRAPVLAEQALVTGIVPLTPIQHWFFAQALPQPHHYNQAVLLQVKAPLNRVWLEQTLAALLQHHDALRAQFTVTETGWQQQITSPSDQLPLIEIDWTELSATPFVGLSEHSNEQQIKPSIAEKITQSIEQAAQPLQASLDLGSQLVQVAWFRLGQPDGDRLLFIVHHLVIDGVSWRILLEDFQTIYQQLAQGRAPQLPAKTTSVQQWAERLQSYANSDAIQPQFAYWNAFSTNPVHLPVDFPAGENTVATSEQIRIMFSIEQTQMLLTAIPKAYSARIQEVLLRALAQTLSEWSGQSSFLVDVESHGRDHPWEDIDLSRTVGWFTTISPILLTVTGNQIEANLQSIKTQIRTALDYSFAYGTLRYLSTKYELPNYPQAEVSFNYLGQFDIAQFDIAQLDTEKSNASIPAATAPLLERIQQPLGSTQSLLQPKHYRLEINGAISAGQLYLDWSYSRDQYHHSTMLHLTQRFRAYLLDLIQSSQSESDQTSQAGDNPSDVALVELDPSQLAAVLAQVAFEPINIADEPGGNS